MNKKQIITSTIAGVLALGVSATAPNALAADMGKCWGGAAAGKNDCATKDGKGKCSNNASCGEKDKNCFKKATKEDCEKSGGSWEAGTEMKK